MKITIYGHRFCPQVHSVQAVLDHLELDYEYVDIRGDEAARARVMEINNGFESVPTLAFPDGSTLTEPSEDALYAHLHALGLQLDPPSGLERVILSFRQPIVPAFGLGVVIGGMAFGSPIVVGVGILLIITPFLIRLI